MANTEDTEETQDISVVHENEEDRGLSYETEIEPATHTNKTFPFFDLPAEIRNMVFSMLCKCKSAVYADVPKKRSNPGSPFNTLRRVSQRMRSEAANVFYGGNVFIFDGMSFSPYGIHKIVPAHRHFLRHIILAMHPLHHRAKRMGCSAKVELRLQHVRYGADASMTWMRDGTCGDCARLHHAVPEKLIKVVESMEMRNKYPILTLGKLEELFEAAPWNHE